MAAIGTRAKAQSGDGPQAKQLKQKILTTMDADTHTHVPHTHSCTVSIFVMEHMPQNKMAAATEQQQQSSRKAS